MRPTSATTSRRNSSPSMRRKLPSTRRVCSPDSPISSSTVEKLRTAIAAETALTRPVTQLRGLADLDDKPAETHVLRRGDFNNKGKAVSPGVPAVLARSGFRLETVPQFGSSGRRRAFAEWLVDPSNPMTARLHMNRLWAWHFGKGIVETLDDFGHTGKPPTHPELLDWLATEFAAQRLQPEGNAPPDRAVDGLPAICGA